MKGKLRMEDEKKNITEDDLLKLNRFSFGCFACTGIWAIFNKCWEVLGLVLIMTLFFILFQVPKPIYLGIDYTIYFIFSFYALRISYKRQNKDINSFLKTQKKWDIAGVIFIILNLYFMSLGY